MASFDIVSEVDRQEVRNAVDQAQREVANRFDFKNTNSTIELNDLTITMHTVSEDRLNALRTVLEEKLVRRKVSLRGVEYGDVTEAKLPVMSAKGICNWCGRCIAPRPASTMNF